MLVVLTLHAHITALFVVGYVFRIFNHKHFFLPENIWTCVCWAAVQSGMKFAKSIVSSGLTFTQ